MLNKNFDMAVVGQNPFSFLLALELAGQGQQVVMLDDHRVQVGEEMAPTMTLLDKELLRLWGEERKILPFANIDQYLSPESLMFCVDGVQLRLGLGPKESARELSRKLPDQLNLSEVGDELAEVFAPYIRNLAHRIFHFQGVESFRAPNFLVECPEPMRKVFQAFLPLARAQDLLKGSGPSPKDYWKGKAFMFAARSFFQWCPWAHASELESHHLACALLSPCFRVDAPRLMRDLASQFLERGGQLKRTEISDWQTHHGKPWGVELASFDGIIHPKRLAFFGPLPARLGLKLAPVPEVYQGLSWKLPLPPAAREALPQGQRYLWSESQRMGTSMPLLELWPGPEGAQGKILCSRDPASKVDFYRAQAQALLQEALGQLFPVDLAKAADWKGLTLEFGPELWPAPLAAQANRPRTTSKAVNLKPQVRSQRPQNFGQRLQNVDYFGPLKEGVLGPLSTLLDVKDFVQLQ